MDKQIRDYYRRAQVSGCPPITLEAVYASDGTTPVTAVAGEYPMVVGNTYYIKLTGIESTATNAPVLVSNTPAMTEASTIAVYVTADAKENMLEVVVDQSTDGSETHALVLTWDNGTCVQEGTINFAMDISF